MEHHYIYKVINAIQIKPPRLTYIGKQSLEVSGLAYGNEPIRDICRGIQKALRLLLSD